MTTAAPLSIIVPIYNGSNTLQRCVDSVLASRAYQRDMAELVLINDGSTDDTSAMSAHIAANHERVRAFDTDNHGVSAARNRGIDEAFGTYITFLDCDDFVSPEYHARQLDALTRSPDTDLTIAGLTTLEGDTQVPAAPTEGRQTVREVAASITSLASRALLNLVGTKMYRSSLLHEYGIRFEVGRKSAEDLLFNLDVLAVAQTVHMIDDTGMYYVRGEGSTTETLAGQYDPAHELVVSVAYRAALEERFERLEVPASESLRYFQVRDQVWFHTMVTNILKPGSPYIAGEQLTQIRRIMDFEPPRQSILADRSRNRLPLLNRALYRINSARLVRQAFSRFA